MKTFFGAFFGALAAILISSMAIIHTFQPLLAVNVAVAEKVLGAAEADRVAQDAQKRMMRDWGSDQAQPLSDEE